MVKYSHIQQKHIFRALADPIRLDIIKKLQLRGSTVSNLAKQYPISIPAISKHLKILQKAGLVRSSKWGRRRTYSLDRQHLRHFYNFIKDLIKGDPIIKYRKR